MGIGGNELPWRSAAELRARALQLTNMRSLFAVMVALSVAACGGSKRGNDTDGGNGGRDGGSSRDTGAESADGGEQDIDAGRPRDDGGPMPDTGGTGLDAGTTHDGGGPFDAGVFFGDDASLGDAGPDRAPTYVWSGTFGGPSVDAAKVIATDDAGNAYIAGILNGSIDFGVGALTAVGGYDTFVVKLAPSGIPMWSISFGGAGRAAPNDITVDRASGDVYVVGEFDGDFTVGASTTTSAGGNDIYIASFTSGGVFRWDHRFGGTGDDVANGVAIDPSGGMTVSGWFANTVAFGGESHTASGILDVWVAHYDTDGTYGWASHFGGDGLDEGHGVGADLDGNVYFVGALGGQADFGGGVIPPSPPIGETIFVASVDDKGDYRWAHTFGGGGPMHANAIAVSRNGDLFVTGVARGALDFGTGTLGGPGARIFVASFDRLGATRWAKVSSGTIPDTLNSGGFDVSLDALGRVFVCGRFENAVDLGTPLSATGMTDGYIGSFSSTGMHFWSRAYGAEGIDSVQSCAAFGDARLWISGYYSGSVDFGAGPRMATGTDMFVVRLDR